MFNEFKQVILTIGPSANSQLADSLSRALADRYGQSPLTTRTRVAHLLAQMAVETKWFTDLDEDLSYRAERLMQVWPRRFPTLAAAQPFARNPRALANRVYNGRMGNREDTNDGYDFRGCGGLHHTGRSEHEVRARAIGVSLMKFGRLMRDHTQGKAILDAAISYCDDRRVWPAMDANDVIKVTEIINGGRNGLDDRKLALSRAMRAVRVLP